MSTRIEDSPRAHQSRWIIEAVASGDCAGAVLTPWASPWVNITGPGKKPGLRERVIELAQEGVEIWFDAMTHAVDMPGMGDLRYYAQYDLWGGPRGDLSNAGRIHEHVNRVFGIQDLVGSPHIAPTVLLHAGLSAASVTALDVAREAIRLDPSAIFTIAGTPPFWQSGSALDAHVGALASLSPGGWNLVVVRGETGVPVSASAQEVFGLCRTSRALSEYAPVHISHGDLAGLPAIAAGATTVGTGWDQRQRVCSAPDYSARSPKGGGGGWLYRPTLRLLMGLLSDKEGVLLSAMNPALANHLGGLPVHGPREVFVHHLHQVAELVRDIAAGPDFESRYRRGLDLYNVAASEWPAVERLVSVHAGARQWVDPFRDGLKRYGAGEGW